MRLPEYFGFAVTGRGGESKRDRSEVVTKPPPVPGGKPYQVYKGLYFDESQWDGSDIFLVDAKIVVTKAVRDAFKQSKISNVLFTCLIDVETDVLLDKYGK